MGSLIEVERLPVSPLQLQAIQARGEQRLKDANSLVCTQESLMSVKTERAEVQKEYDALEEWRKAIKHWAMEEYKRFEDDYKAASKGYVDALALYSEEIQETEAAIKQTCEDGLRTYFDELCAVHHLDWLTYERAGIKVDMASAKSKTPKRLREQLTAFVVGVSDSVDRITLLDDADEILVEFQSSLDAADAICTVRERHQRAQEQKAARELRNSEREKEAEMVHRVEALSPPVAVQPPERDPNDVFEHFSFTLFNVKRSQLWEVRDFLKERGIQYE